MVSALSLSFVVGGTVLFFELRAKEHAIASLARIETATFVSRLSDHFEREPEDHAEVELGLAELLRERAHVPDGHFISGRVYSAEGTKIAEETMIATFAPALSTPDELDAIKESKKSAHNLLFAGGNIYVRVLAVIPGIPGTKNGFFEGFYLVDRETLLRLAEHALVAVSVCVVAVLGNTGFLHPTLLSLSRRLVDLSRDLLHANLGMLEVLGSAIALRDSETSHHNYRVTIYAASLGKALELPPEEMRKLVKGAFLHDVGKIAIGDAILLKPGSLTAEEFEQIKSHVDHGLDVIRRSKWLSDAEAIVGGHHERWDGTGYPRGLTGESIPLLARIFAVADVFDALTSRRPYKSAMSFQHAWETLDQGRGMQFDPAVLDVFQRVSGEVYAQFVSRGENELKTLLSRITAEYFQ